MLKLWGRVNSINVQKVRWALAELNVAYERFDAGMQFGVVNEPHYRRLNPNGRVPTIEDDRFVLWESNAIVRYLACRHGEGGLWPADVRQRADADRWMDWTSSTLQPLITPVFWGLVRTPAEQRDMAAIHSLIEKTDETFLILEEQLADRPYVAGSALTMGDIVLGPFVHRWYGMPIERRKHARVEAYFERLQERPAYRDTVMIPLT